MLAERRVSARDDAVVSDGAAPAWPEDPPRRFLLFRHLDTSGVSGVGRVADGVAFANGAIVLCEFYRAGGSAVSVWASVGDMLAVHGAPRSTDLVWLD